MALLSFADAIEEAKERGVKPHLLLGNGFSISCRPDIFHYGKLFENADFSSMSPYVKGVFGALKTQDFERVIKVLRDARLALMAYSAPDALLNQLDADANGLRELLVETIADSHPAWPGEISEAEYQSCRIFLSNFKCVYTFNYDLLLYWTQMHVNLGERPSSDDGFRKSQDNFDAEYVTWDPSQSHEQNMWFLHGALHVFDSGTEVQKYTWKNTGTRLIDQIREAISKDYFPIFVSEGTSAEKYSRIRHNDYLAKAYRSFSAIQGTMFILGHSLAENDEHYLKAIERGKVSQLYVGLHGDPLSPGNKAIVRRANQLSSRRLRSPQLAISFFDSATAQVWNR